MARLPTVKLRHRRTGETKIINQTDYARDIAAFARDWSILSVRHGNATDDEIIRDKLESDLNKWRLENPAEQKWRGDQDRRMAQNRMVIHGDPDDPVEFVSADAPAAEAAPDAPAAEPAADTPAPVDAPGSAVHGAREAVDPDWDSWPWHRKRDYVQRLTGKRPSNAQDARSLISVYETSARYDETLTRLADK